MRPAKSSRSHSRSPMTVQHDPPSDPIPPLQSNVRIRTVNNPLSRASLGCCFDVARVTVSHSTATVNCHCPYVRSDPIRSGVRGRVGKLGGGEGTGEIQFVSIRFDSIRFECLVSSILRQTTILGTADLEILFFVARALRRFGSFDALPHSVFLPTDVVPMIGDEKDPTRSSPIHDSCESCVPKHFTSRVSQ